MKAGRILGVTALVVLGWAGAATLWLRAAAREAEPAYSGVVELPGLSAAVTVTYGPHAVPSIRAGTLPDLFVAQGYVVARERLWQMDVLRRLGRGRLAESFGPGAVAVDTLARTLGLGRAAEASVEALSPEVRGLVEAFARGVNAYREEARSRLPLEYRLALLEPAPWEAADSLAVLEYMSYLLSYNARHEIAFLKLAERLGPEQARELFPVDEGVPAPAPARELGEALGGLRPAVAEAQELLAALPAHGPASNSWVVAAARSRTGRPLLASDPHLAPTVPALWYEMEMEAPGYHVAGISLPGVPFVLIGHNEALAWGLTTTMADTQDVVLERLTPDRRAVDRPGGGREPLDSWLETIAVRGAEPRRLEVRRSSNGVVLNGVLARPAGTPVDFAPLQTDLLVVLKSNLDLADRSLEGIFSLNRARDVTELRAALALVRRASQTVTYAHRDGPTGRVVTGALPLRRSGYGPFPTPGWVEGFGWDGHLPADQNPRTEGPGPAGALVAANHRTVGPDYPHPVAAVWMPAYRAQRIEELLAAGGLLGPGDLAAMQLDVVAVEGRRYQAALRRLEPELRALDPQAWALAEATLLRWDGRFDPASRAAAFLTRLRPRLAEALWADELGDDLPELLRLTSLGYHPLQEVVSSGQSSFWDDRRTSAREGPAHVWARALREAAAPLDRFGATSGLRLDQVRTLTFPHPFHGLPLAAWVFDLGPLGVGGDDHTVNVAKSTLADPGEVQFIPSYRVVFAPGRWAETRGTSTLGQSGHLLSAYRSDQLADWLAGRTHPWPWGGPAAGAALGTLRLAPRGARDP